jgi:hypothetical protein
MTPVWTQDGCITWNALLALKGLVLPILMVDLNHLGLFEIVMLGGAYSTINKGLCNNS